MSERVPYVQHGRRHGPSGSDPIPGVGEGIQFDTDNEGGWLDITVSDTDGGGDGFLVVGDGVPIHITGDGGTTIEDSAPIVIDGNSLTLKANAGFEAPVLSLSPIGETVLKLNSIAGGEFAINDHNDNPVLTVAEDGTIDAQGHKIVNGADGVNPTDFATVEQLSGGVTSLDSITGAVTLVSGSNVTITPNSPSPGDITIAATGSGGGALPGNSSLVYRYTVTGSDKATIDTGVDTPDAGSNDWTNGDLLEIFLIARTDEASVQSNIGVRLNNDAAANYYRQVTSVTDTSTSNFAITGETALVVQAAGASQDANIAGVVELVIPGYAGTTFAKAVSSRGASPGIFTANMEVDVRTLLWNNTGAVTRLAVAAVTAGKKLKVGTQLLIYKRLAA